MVPLRISLPITGNDLETGAKKSGPWWIKMWSSIQDVKLLIGVTGICSDFELETAPCHLKLKCNWKVLWLNFVSLLSMRILGLD